MVSPRGPVDRVTVLGILLSIVRQCSNPTLNPQNNMMVYVCCVCLGVVVTHLISPSPQSRLVLSCAIMVHLSLAVFCGSFLEHMLPCGTVNVFRSVAVQFALMCFFYRIWFKRIGRH